LRLSLDVINAGNLFNRNWGLVQSFTSTSPLKYEGISTDPATAGKPKFSFPYLDPANQVPVVNSYINNPSYFNSALQTLSSRWQMQFGIRYLFN